MRSLVLGYCCQIVKKASDSEVMAEFFREHKSDETIRGSFMGYEMG